MTSRFIKNTRKHNRGKDVNYDLKDLSCQRKNHPCSHLNNSLLVITKSNCSLKL